MTFQELDPKEGRIVPMRVIVCGVQRTGTLSIRRALWRLGIFDCYHMHTNFHHGDRDSPYWVKALHAKYNPDPDNPPPSTALTKEEWDELLGRCQAVCDVPPALFGPELAEVYPDAKVIILNRDPEKWWESVYGAMYKQMFVDATIWDRIKFVYRLAFDPVSRGAILTNGTMAKLAMPYNHGTEKEKALQWYKDIYQEFRDRIPEERRLEYSIKDGWEPLCEFLGVDVPMKKDGEGKEEREEEFPHVNDRESFNAGFRDIGDAGVERANGNVMRLVGKGVVYGAVGYGVYLSWKTRLGGRV